MKLISSSPQTVGTIVRLERETISILNQHGKVSFRSYTSKFPNVLAYCYVFQIFSKLLKCPILFWKMIRCSMAVTALTEQNMFAFLSSIVVFFVDQLGG